MTPEAQQIALAEAVGFTDIREEEHESVDIESRTIVEWSSLDGTLNGQRVEVPHYLHDLNVVHAALPAVINTFDLRRTLIRQLVCADDRFDNLQRLAPDTLNDRETWVNGLLQSLDWSEVWCFCLRATAGDLVEAILKTLGKWDDSK